MRAFVAWTTLALAGCGRLGFDAFASGANSGVGDDGTALDAIVTPDSAVTCSGAAQQLAIDAPGITDGEQWVSDLYAAPTVEGFGVAYFAPDNSLIGAEYAGAAGSFHEVAPDVGFAGSNTVASVGGVIAVGASGGSSRLLVAASALSNEVPQLYPVDQTFAMKGPMKSQASSVLAGGPLANSGDGTTHAMLFIDTAAGSALAATTVSLGGDFGSRVTVAPASNTPVAAMIAPASSGYVIAWIDNVTSPTVVHAALVDASLAITTTDTIVGSDANTTENELQPRAAWGATANAFVFVWAQIQGTTSVIVAQVRDATLGALSAPVTLGTGTNPRIATDGREFTIVWNDPTTTSNLSWATVNATDHPGRFVTGSVVGTGGTVVSYDVAALGDGVALIWYERFLASEGCGGSSPPANCYTPLWIVPACAL